MPLKRTEEYKVSPLRESSKLPKQMNEKQKIIKERILEAMKKRTSQKKY